MAILSWNDTAKYAWGAGFRGGDLVTITAIAQPESSRNTNSRYVTSREDSRGVWQINTYAHPNFDKNRLYQPDYNAYAAFIVYRNVGGKLTPWTTYTTGKYKPFMGNAQSAVNYLRSLGYNVGSGGGESPAPPQGGGEGAAPLQSADWNIQPAVRYTGDRFSDLNGILTNLRTSFDYLR